MDFSRMFMAEPNMYANMRVADLNPCDLRHAPNGYHQLRLWARRSELEAGGRRPASGDPPWRGQGDLSHGSGARAVLQAGRCVLLEVIMDPWSSNGIKSSGRFVPVLDMKI